MGEYGSDSLRPHWHAILFGVVPTQASLDSLWPQGFTSIGEVNARSAAYVAKYTVKALRVRPRFVVDPTTGESVRLVPEFARMSLRPGIGALWFSKHWADVYAARDGVVLPGGFTVRPPRYYDTLLERLDCGLFNSKRFARVHLADGQRDARSSRNLLALEAHAIARSSLKKEKL